MRKILVLIAGLLLAWPAGAKEVNKTLDADADGRVEISNTAGSVEVVGWDRKQVEVTGTLGNEVDKFIFERDGNEITVRVKAKSGRSGSRSYSSDIVVRVPWNSSVEVSSVSADIDIEGVRGELEVESVSGDIEFEIFAAAVDAQSVSGDIDVEGKGDAGDTRLETVSGDIDARNLGGELRIDSVSGDLSVAGGSFHESRVSTVNGDIDYVAGLGKGGKLYIESVNGDVDVRFTGSVSAVFDIETFNGRIRNCFGPKPEKASKYSPGWDLRFTQGKGEGRVSISTLNGGVGICTE